MLLDLCQETLKYATILKNALIAKLYEYFLSIRGKLPFGSGATSFGSAISICELAKWGVNF